MSDEIIRANETAMPEIIRDAISKWGMFVAKDNPDSIDSKVAVYNATTGSEMRLRFGASL